MEMTVDVVGREVIIPYSPAPRDRLQLSLFDLSCPEMYVSTIFFFKTSAGESSENITGRLKTSLPETLSRFYPLAGRIEGISISCNDEGAVFTEARTDIILSDFLKKNLDDIYSLGEFFPTMAPGESPGAWPLLTVKVSTFGSGSGVAVAVAISHHICDVASLLTFVNDWATTTRKGKSKDGTMPTPLFVGATIYPPPDVSFNSPLGGDLLELRGKCVTNRFVFKSSKISELKRKAASESVPVPTRVEAITSLIWRCATNASRSNSVAPKTTLMTQAMDLRLRFPSNVLPVEAVGNLQSAFFLKKSSESKMEIGEIVVEFRKAKDEFNEMIKENLHGYNSDSTMITSTTLGQNLLNVMGYFMSEIKPDIDLYIMSSWCKKPFYEVDFGFGTPVWIGSATHTMYDNQVYAMVMDSKDGEDVEAWVSLPKQDMHVFLGDQDLLSYAVVNPPVLI